MSICSHALYDYLVEDLQQACPRLKTETALPEYTTREFSAYALAAGFLSKDRDHPMPNADDRALEKFKASNLRCQNWYDQRSSLLDDLLIGEFRSSVDRFLHPRGDLLFDSLFDLLDHGRVGPGASIGARGNDFYSKFFSSPLTVTKDSLYSMYSQWINGVPYWGNAEKIRKQHYGDVTTVNESRLTFVPKKNDCSRVICIEPSLNMYYQLGLEEILRSRLKSYFRLDLEVQADVNRELAYEGSLRDKSYVTVDLSSASDSISLNMLKCYFPKWFVDYLSIIRSPNCRLPSGEQVELSMISSMGNGSTFPLETMIFACAVEAVYKLDNQSLRKDGKPFFSVFGDDIIVLQKSYWKLERLLTLLGFQINRDKTFVEGPFRESCGHDYLNGSYVRPVFVKTLREQGSLYALINNLTKWSYLNSIPLSRTIKYLLRHVKWNPVPLDENDDAGIRVPFEFAGSTRRDRYTGSLLYQRFVPRSKRYEIRDFDIRGPSGSKRIIYNHFGLWISFLRGSIYSHGIAIRLKSTAYGRKWRVTHNWDHVPSGFDPTGSKVDWGRLKTSYYFNFKLR